MLEMLVECGWVELDGANKQDVDLLRKRITKYSKPLELNPQEYNYYVRGQGEDSVKVVLYRVKKESQDDIN